MTNEQAIEVIRKEYACVDADCDIERSCGKCELHLPSKEPILKAYEMAIQALSQEPCEDVVSRDWLKTAIHNFYYGLKHTPTEEDIQAYIDAAPSVTHKSGKWILLDECANSGYYCSNCQKKLVKEGWSNTVKKIKYCPNCGAKMESEE